jgi:23S rRNA pseudouridine1911/1915/1917 synthase
LTGQVVFDVSPSDGETRLDTFVSASVPDLSRSRARALIERGLVLVNGAAAEKPSLRLAPGQRVTVLPPEPEPSHLTPWDMPLTVVLEDEDMLVIEKPAGMTVHPAPGHPDDTLANAVVAHWPELAGVGDPARPGIVHRLDADTSGLIIVAKNVKAHAALSAQFAERRVGKRYTGLVVGTLERDEAVIDGPIGRSPRDRKKMAVVSTGRPASTGFKVTKRFADKTLVEVRPTTGRTHQIRVHFASIGHAVVGDSVYGRPDPDLARQFLHASGLAFEHPSTGRKVELVSELPPDLGVYLSEVLKFRPR